MTKEFSVLVKQGSYIIFTLQCRIKISQIQILELLSVNQYTVKIINGKIQDLWWLHFHMEGCHEDDNQHNFYINIPFTSTYCQPLYISHESVIVLPSSGWLEAWSSYTDMLYWNFFCFLEWHFIDLYSLPQDSYSITSRAWLFLNFVYNGIKDNKKINEFTTVNNYSIS